MIKTEKKLRTKSTNICFEGITNALIYLEKKKKQIKKCIRARMFQNLVNYAPMKSKKEQKKDKKKKKKERKKSKREKKIRSKNKNGPRQEIKILKGKN